MKKLLIPFLSLFFCCFADPQEDMPSQQNETEEIAKISQALGHLLAQQLKENALQVDIKQVVKGIEDEEIGGESSMTKENCIAILAAFQEKKFKEMSDKNLQEAESFLENNAQKESIVEVEKGKLQYSIEKEGDGIAIKETDTPLLKYEGTFLDGQVFDQTQEPITLSLNETIPGFGKGILGMKEGEVRRIYVHPDLGYGTDATLPPNSLLSFKVELVKANKPLEKECSENKELADKKDQAVR